MANVTITEAARLTGKSTQTLYRHIKSGKLSRLPDGSLDTSELMRVYGAMQPSVTTLSVTSDATASCHETENERWLKSQIEKLQQDIRELKAESLERERRLMALLENKVERHSDTNSAGGLFGKLFGK